MSKLKACGIVAEFNPFHFGHEYLIKRAREMGFSTVAVVMSGNYTQRGEPACMLKGARVKSALACGADIVFELPLPYAVSSAEKFAYGAVSLLDSLGALDSLVFGSETAETERLSDCAQKLLDLNGSPLLSDYLSRGYSFPKARELAMGKEYSDILSNPNDTLGIEYIKALKNLNSKMTPIAIKRFGAGHDERECIKDGVVTASASFVRKSLSSKTPLDSLKYLPEKSAEILKTEIEVSRAPFQAERFSLLALAQLRRLTPEDFAALPDVSEGLENRLYNAARTAATLEEFYMSVKSKRYTLSRIRRITLCAVLGIDKSYTSAKPPYLRVLGFNSKGVKLLAKVKKSVNIPIVSRCADIRKLPDFSKKLFELECLSSDLYCLALPKILPCGLEQKFTPIKVD